MGTKRVGLARIEALIENLKREITLNSGTHLSGVVTQGTTNTATSLGCKKVQSFAGSLADTDTGAAYGNNDCLVYLGALDTSLPSGMNAATKIFIERVFVCVQTASGITLEGHIDLGTTASEATNASITGRAELMGAGATYKSADGVTGNLTITEADIDLNTAGLSFASPNLTFASTVNQLYLAATTTLNGDASAGRFNVVVEYIVL